MSITINTADLRNHADSIEGRFPTIAARARAAADRIDAQNAALETLGQNGTARVNTKEEATKVAEIWNETNTRKAVIFPLAGGWIIANGATRQVTPEESARIACFLGVGPKVCTCGRTDGKHGLLCGLN